MEQQIRETRQMIDREQTATVVDETQALNPIHQSVEGDYLRTEAQLSGLQARRANAGRDLAGYRTRQQKLEAITAQHEDLERQVKIAEENYLLHEKKRQESRMADALEQQKILDVSVVEKAVPPALPADRHRAFLLFLGLVAGLGAGFAAALAAEHFDRPLSSPADLLAFAGLPVLLTRSTDKLTCS